MKVLIWESNLYVSDQEMTIMGYTSVVAMRFSVFYVYVFGF
jgi:hypothetical protein